MQYYTKCNVEYGTILAEFNYDEAVLFIDKDKNVIVVCIANKCASIVLYCSAEHN